MKIGESMEEYLGAKRRLPLHRVSLSTHHRNPIPVGGLEHGPPFLRSLRVPVACSVHYQQCSLTGTIHPLSSSLDLRLSDVHSKSVVSEEEKLLLDDVQRKGRNVGAAVSNQRSLAGELNLISATPIGRGLTWTGTGCYSASVQLRLYWRDPVALGILHLLSAPLFDSSSACVYYREASQSISTSSMSRSKLHGGEV